MLQRNIKHALLVAAALAIAGCNDKIDLPAKPVIDVDAAVAQAFEQFDANSNGVLDAKELRQAPGVLYGLSRVDANKDQKVSRDELAQRLTYWNESPQRVFNLEVELTYRNRPVSGAEVAFEPEPFLADALRPVSGTTDSLGRIIPRTSSDFPGIDKGYYRVKVSKPGANLPPQVNEQTRLGIEFTDDRPEQQQFMIELPLDAAMRN